MINSSSGDNYLNNNLTDSNIAPNETEPPSQQASASQQLMRSKSLNDISNDYQISAFASDRFINLHQQQQQQNVINNSDNNYDNCNDGIRGNNVGLVSNYNNVNRDLLANCLCPDNSFNFIQQQQQQQQQIINNSNNYYGNQSFNNPMNLINDQCSRFMSQPQTLPTTSTTAAPSAANVFNLCNPLAINNNLSGVTEQIENLHL